MEARRSNQSITGMTMDELRALIAEEVRAQVTGEIETQLRTRMQQPDMTQADEALRWLREHRLPLSLHAPSVVQMLREDRDR
jgi:hypothetical protein